MTEQTEIPGLGEGLAEIVTTAKGRRFMSEVMAKAERIRALEGEAKQLRADLANEVTARATELACDLSFEDCAGLLYALADGVRS